MRQPTSIISGDSETRLDLQMSRLLGQHLNLTDDDEAHGYVLTMGWFYGEYWYRGGRSHPVANWPS